MTYLTAVILGLVRGITELLPISGSGHLAMLQNFLHSGTTDEHLLFDALLQFGMMGAVILGFWNEVKGLWREGLTMLGIKKPHRGQKPDRLRRRTIWFVILATLPLIAVAFLRDAIAPFYGNTFFVGFALLITGGLLFAADRMGHGNKNEKNATLGEILIVGLTQAVAALPGLSCVGTTVSVGMLLGFDRNFAVRFSFLLLIPALLGKSFLSLIRAFGVGVNAALIPAYLLGASAAFVSGYVSIYLLRRLVQRGRFGGFSYYCWGAGLVTLILSLVA